MKGKQNAEAVKERERYEVLAEVLATKLPKVTAWDLKQLVNLDVDGEALNWNRKRLFDDMVAEFVQPGDVVEAMQAKTAATVKAKLAEVRAAEQRKASLERLRKPAARKPARGHNYAAQEKRQAGREAKTVKRLERAGVIKPEPAAKGAKTRASAAELVTVDAKVLAAGLKSGSSFAIGDVLKGTSLTRIQAASALERLIAAGRLVRAGKGRGARYHLEAQGGPAAKQPDLFDEGEPVAPAFEAKFLTKLLRFAKWWGPKDAFAIADLVKTDKAIVDMVAAKTALDHLVGTDQLQNRGEGRYSLESPNDEIEGDAGDDQDADDEDHHP